MLRSKAEASGAWKLGRRLCSAAGTASVVSIDRKGLRGGGVESGGRALEPVENGTKPAMTPLAKSMYKRIAFAGPMTIAAYMSECLTNPRDGYYMKRDVFGQRGDFTTAPEVSQVFGEMLGVWVWANWQAMGQPDDVDLVEMGPGRGTLMADVLRTVQRLGNVKWNVRLIEASPFLKNMQEKKLANFGLSPSWHANLSELDEKRPAIVLAQEFMDAMPVNQFVRVDKDVWRERFVDIDEDPESPYHFRYILSPRATPAAQLYREHYSSVAPDFPIVEVSPAALSLTHQLCSRIQQSGCGAALLVDYGHDSVHRASLRAIRNHEMASPLDGQGEADLSADVDFGALRRQAQKVEGVKAYGPVTQSTLLHALGASERFRTLAEKKPDAVERLYADYKRLTHPSEMGEVYKALALAHESQGVPPGGFSD